MLTPTNLLLVMCSHSAVHACMQIQKLMKVGVPYVYISRGSGGILQKI